MPGSADGQLLSSLDTLVGDGLEEVVRGAHALRLRRLATLTRGTRIRCELLGPVMGLLDDG